MKIGLVAGEASGDLLGAGLIRALRQRDPNATFEGVAGPAMLAAGCEQWEPAESLAVIEKANEILEQYAAQGFDLTLRQLYYQFVARDLVPNS